MTIMINNAPSQRSIMIRHVVMIHNNNGSLALEHVRIMSMDTEIIEYHTQGNHINYL